MAGKRKWGTGSVYRTADGRWRGSWEAPTLTSTGKRKRILVSAKTEREARSKLNDKIAHAMEHGLKISNGMTVKAWSDEWLPRYQKRVAPKTYQNAASSVRKYIVPTIGKRRVDELTAADIRSVHDAIRAAGNGSSTALRCHTVMQSMLTAAVREGINVPHQAREVEAPRKNPTTRGAIPLDQAKRLVTRALDDPAGSRWVAALHQGIRPAEALGLTWECVDLEQGVLDISWQLQALRYVDRYRKDLGFQIPDGYEARHLTRAYHLVRPKTQSGRRLVPMAPAMLTSLKELYGGPSNPWGLVWWRINEQYGSHLPMPISDKHDREAWVELQRAARVKHTSGRFYDLYEARHTCATLLLEEGVDPKIIQAIMGHSDILVTHRYQHVGVELARSALMQVAGRLNIAS